MQGVRNVGLTPILSGHLNIRKPESEFASQEAKVDSVISEDPNDRQYRTTPREYSTPFPFRLPDVTSFIHVYSHERENLALQRIKANMHRWEIIDQRVRIITAPDGEGIGLIAVGGESKTTLENEQGLTRFETDQVNSESLRQAGTRWFLGLDKELGPQLRLFDGYGSGLAVQKALRDLGRAAPSNDSPVPKKSIDFRVASAQVERIGSLFGGIAQNLQARLVEGTFSGLQIRSQSDGFEFSLGANANPGTYEMNLKALALPYRIASAERSDPSAALGLTGTLRIGGEEISVETSDTLYSLAEKIGQTEDSDDDSMLDVGEDRNGNGLLDVGNSTSGVHAWVEDNRLILEAASAGSQRFEIVSTGSVAETLGLLEMEASNSTNYANVLQAGSDAILAYDGQDYEGTGNSFSDLPFGIEVSVDPTALRTTPSEDSPLALSVEVTESRHQIIDALKDFVRDYNSAMEEFNGSVMYPGLLDSDGKLFNLRNQIIDALDSDRKNEDDGTTRTFGSIAEIGLDTIRGGRLSAHELALRRMENAPRSFWNPIAIDSIPSMTTSLDRIGIVNRKDGLLELDEETLVQAIETSRQGVSDLLTGDTTGVFPRLIESIEEARQSPNGILAYQIEYYDSLAATIRTTSAESPTYAKYSYDMHMALGSVFDAIG